MRLSIAEAIEQYGSEGTKAHFCKYKRIVSKSVNDSFLKTLRQHFDSIEKVKEGRKVYYQLLGKKELISIREDGRSKGGNRTVPYSDHIDMLLLSVFPESNINTDIFSSSLSDILKRTKIQSENQNKIVSRLYEVKNYGNDIGINRYILYDVKNEFSLFNEHVKRSMFRLERNKMISIRTSGSVAFDASLIDQKGDKQEFEVHVGITNDTLNNASLKVKEGALREDVKVFSVLYGSSDEKTKKIKAERDEYLKEKLMDSQGSYEDYSSGYWIDYNKSKVMYMYKKYQITSKVTKDEIDTMLMNTMNKSYDSLEEMNRNLTLELQQKRKEYILKRILDKYDALRTELLPYEDEEWGEQESLLRKNNDHQKTEYYDKIESKEADSLVVKILDQFFSEENLPYYVEPQKSKTDTTKVTLNDSSIEFETHDPFPLVQQQSDPSTFHLIQ